MNSKMEVGKVYVYYNACINEIVMVMYSKLPNTVAGELHAIFLDWLRRSRDE